MVEILRYGKEQEIKSTTTYKSYDDSNIVDKEQVRDLGIRMSNTSTCTLFMVLFLCRMCRCGLHAVMLWSHIGTLMRLLAAESRRIAGLSFTCQYLCGTILVTACSMVWVWRVSNTGQCLFIGLDARSLFVSCCFPFLFFHSMGWCCGIGVFGLIGCWSLSPSLALPTFYNNNNNNNTLHIRNIV